MVYDVTQESLCFVLYQIYTFREIERERLRKEDEADSENVRYQREYVVLTFFSCRCDDCCLFWCYWYYMVSVNCCELFDVVTAMHIIFSNSSLLLLSSIFCASAHDSSLGPMSISFSLNFNV